MRGVTTLAGARRTGRGSSRVSTLLRLIAIVLCLPPVTSAMASAPEPRSIVVNVPAEPEGADGGSTASAARATRSGGKALAIGLAATFVPAGLGLVMDPARSDGQGGEFGLAVGVTVGVLFGPAVGLASGSRGDLAWRGLAIRGVGGALLLLGAAAAITSIDEGTDSGSVGIMWVGAAGGAVAVASTIYDLAITPRAVSEGRRVSVRPVVTSNGMVGLRASF